MTNRHELSVADQRVVAVHHEAASEQWLFFCHGLRSDKTGSYEARCERAVTEGYNAVRFDFRGCGESDGQFAASTLGARIDDLRAVVDHFDPPRCVLFGSSFGGAVALQYAARADGVTAVATRAPVTNPDSLAEYRDAVERDGEYHFETGETVDGRFFRDLDRFDFAGCLSGLDVPVALFHGAADESVPVGDSLTAARRLDVDTLVQTFAGEGHLFSRDAEARMQELLFAWLDQYGP